MIGLLNKITLNRMLPTSQDLYSFN